MQIRISQKARVSHNVLISLSSYRLTKRIQLVRPGASKAWRNEGSEWSLGRILAVSAKAAEWSRKVSLHLGIRASPSLNGRRAGNVASRHVLMSSSVMILHEAWQRQSATECWQSYTMHSVTEEGSNVQCSTHATSLGLMSCFKHHQPETGCCD
jgi:hypothetical protein